MIRLLSIFPSPGAEILQDFQARHPAFFRVKLDGDEIPDRHGGTEGQAVAGPADDMIRLGRIGVIGVNEVELRLLRNTPEDRMFPHE